MYPVHYEIIVLYEGRFVEDVTSTTPLPRVESMAGCLLIGWRDARLVFQTPVALLLSTIDAPDMIQMFGPQLRKGILYEYVM